MKNKGTSISENKARLAFRSGIQGSNSKMMFFIESRLWLPHTLFAESITWLYKQNKLSAAYHKPFPPLVGSLGAYLPHKVISFKRELEWTKSLISLYKKQIQEYIVLKEEFQKMSFSGNFSAAIDILLSIQNKFGYSFWLIKHLLALSQLNKGIEAQKKIANNLKKQFAPQSASRYIIHKLSILNEPSVTPSRFIDEVKNEISTLAMPQDWKLRLTYHITGEVQRSLDEALQILRFATSESMIDTYEAFINIEKVAFVSDVNEKDKQTLIISLLFVNNIIKDSRINSLLYVLSLEDIYAPHLEDMKSYSQLLIKNNNNISNKELSIHQPYIGGLITASLNKIDKSDRGLYSRLAGYLQDVLSKTKDADVSAIELDRLALMLPGWV